jgi:hypothetical protein
MQDLNLSNLSVYIKVVEDKFHGIFLLFMDSHGILTIHMKKCSSVYSY